ncbi:MAG: hypothetical protein ABIJ26_05380 [Candidatus Margulisiibacteriota bacterium]|nr:hypothetical protein [Candidatus Margulisiibacteriota bacterium]
MKKFLIALFCAAVVVGMLAPAMAQESQFSVWGQARVVGGGSGTIFYPDQQITITDPVLEHALANTTVILGFPFGSSAVAIPCYIKSADMTTGRFVVAPTKPLPASITLPNGTTIPGFTQFNYVVVTQ